MLSLRDVGKTYVAGHGGCRAAVRALAGVSLQVRSGELVELSGPRGSGKTTLMLCAAGLLTPDRGNVAWPAAPLAAPSAVRAGFATYLAVRGLYAAVGAALARALERSGARPRLVLVDRADDVDQGAGLATAWLDVMREYGASVIVSSRASRVDAATRVVLLERGRVVRDTALDREPGVAARVAEPDADAPALD